MLLLAFWPFSSWTHHSPFHLRAFTGAIFGTVFPKTFLWLVYLVINISAPVLLPLKGLAWSPTIPPSVSTPVTLWNYFLSGIYTLGNELVLLIWLLVYFLSSPTTLYSFMRLLFFYYETLFCLRLDPLIPMLGNFPALISHSINAYVLNEYI